jgi:hypothetical protein
MTSKQISLAFAIKIQMQALLETMDQLPELYRDQKMRVSNFNEWLEKEQQKATFGFIEKDSYQFIEATNKIIGFANDINLVPE